MQMKHQQGDFRVTILHSGELRSDSEIPDVTSCIFVNNSFIFNFSKKLYFKFFVQKGSCLIPVIEIHRRNT